jgi:hypothetical protein
MKKRIASILIVFGLFVTVSGFRAPFDRNEGSGGIVLTVLKGTVSKTDFDKYWDVVTFGLEGLKANSYKILSVEVWDRAGSLIGEVDAYTRIGKEDNPAWFKADLNGLNLRKDFYLVVHVWSNKLSSKDSFELMAQDRGETDAPIDPEETVLIVKYP